MKEPLMAEPIRAVTMVALTDRPEPEKEPLMVEPTRAATIVAPMVRLRAKAPLTAERAPAGMTAEPTARLRHSLDT
jgi:hypothetical protein